jgi:uncharacterized protein YndB with AHSA1/START domain
MTTGTASAATQLADLNREGALVVRRSIQIAATPERVWREFESFERFAAWWTTRQPDRRETVRAYDLRIGGRIEMPCEWDGGSCVFAVNVVRIDRARELTFELSIEGIDWPAPTYVTIRLTPNAYGTLVEILHYGFEMIGDGALEQFHNFEGGWDLRELRGLKAIVEAASMRSTPASQQLATSFGDAELTIRRSVHINALPERIWREFETFERFSAWFGVLVEEYDRAGARRPLGHTVITYEPRVDGWIELEVEVAGVARRFGGRILAFDPGRELTFEDHWLPPEFDAPLLITIRLVPAAIGGTIVELIQHGFERIGTSAAETHRGHQAGWTARQLEALRAVVEEAGASG